MPKNKREVLMANNKEQLSGILNCTNVNRRAKLNKRY